MSSSSPASSATAMTMRCAAGLRLVEVGFHEPIAGAGVRRVEAWECATAIGPLTAGILYVYGPHARPPLAEVVAVARGSWLERPGRRGGGIASAGQPPRDRGDRGRPRGVQWWQGDSRSAGHGILCGRRELVGAAALQMLDMDDHFDLWEPPDTRYDLACLPGLPRHGIGRGMKVSRSRSSPC